MVAKRVRLTDDDQEKAQFSSVINHLRRIEARFRPFEVNDYRHITRYVAMRPAPIVEFNGVRNAFVSFLTMSPNMFGFKTVHRFLDVVESQDKMPNIVQSFLLICALIAGYDRAESCNTECRTYMGAIKSERIQNYSSPMLGKCMKETPTPNNGSTLQSNNVKSLNPWQALVKTTCELSIEKTLRETYFKGPVKQTNNALFHWFDANIGNMFIHATGGGSDDTMEPQLGDIITAFTPSIMIYASTLSALGIEKQIFHTQKDELTFLGHWLMPYPVSAVYHYVESDIRRIANLLLIPGQSAARKTSLPRIMSLKQRVQSAWDTKEYHFIHYSYISWLIVLCHFKPKNNIFSHEESVWRYIIDKEQSEYKESSRSRELAAQMIQSRFRDHSRYKKGLAAEQGFSGHHNTERQRER